MLFTVFQHEIWMKMVFALFFVTKTLFKNFSTCFIFYFLYYCEKVYDFFPIVYLANTQTFVDIFVHITMNN